jgi:hypothetical protein
VKGIKFNVIIILHVLARLQSVFSSSMSHFSFIGEIHT